jgi:hypothetical protein
MAKSRGGLVAETLGGGFKLKLLDYAFSRLPIFGLEMAVAGVTSKERAAMFLAHDMESLATMIVDNFDNFNKLSYHQEKLFDLFSSRFGLEQGVDRVKDIFIRHI